jgi:pyruvate dehydrogenase E2 component (dihydrolipoamide acetyltransferase)
VPDQSLPISGVRRIIATRMAESVHTAATVTLTTEADATELALLRGRVAADMAGTELAVPSYTDLLVRLVAIALLEHPGLNASLEGDRIVQHTAVHVGIAVDTDRGLLVPVVRDAHTKSVQQIASASAQLIAQARAGKAAPGDLRGGTFTITNLGMYDIDAFTPIINLPECAILGVGRIVARPVVIDEQTEMVAVRKMMALSLSFDHRLVDGAPAARFLKRVKHFVERPYAWLTR